jgi:hypothetical protein
VADRGLKRKFDDPIPLPRGRQLVTLEDVGNYITRLPKAEHETAKWQAAMEALILVATSGGPMMFARIGIMRALNRRVERVFNPDRKEIIGAAGSWRGIDSGTRRSPMTNFAAARPPPRIKGFGSMAAVLIVR